MAASAKVMLQASRGSASSQHMFFFVFVCVSVSVSVCVCLKPLASVWYLGRMATHKSAKPGHTRQCYPQSTCNSEFHDDLSTALIRKVGWEVRSQFLK